MDRNGRIALFSAGIMPSACLLSACLLPACLLSVCCLPDACMLPAVPCLPPFSCLSASIAVGLHAEYRVACYVFVPLCCMPVGSRLPACMPKKALFCMTALFCSFLSLEVQQLSKHPRPAIMNKLEFSSLIDCFV
jgi:hypothetical protein